MQENCVKENIKNIDKIKKGTKRLLIQSIINTNNNLKIARNNYEYAENELIDYYLYEIKANQAKLDYLIKESKQNGIELDIIEKLQIKYLEEDMVV